MVLQIYLMCFPLEVLAIVAMYVAKSIAITGFAKTIPNSTISEIYFITLYNSRAETITHFV